MKIYAKPAVAKAQVTLQAVTAQGSATGGGNGNSNNASLSMGNDTRLV